MSSQFRWINIVGFIFALEICLFGFCNNYEFFHDDAFITLKYVYNFIHGNGIVWNPGEYVEGYTSVLQLLIISVFGKLGFNLFSASRIVGVVAFLALVFFTFFYIKRYDSSILKDHATILKSVPLILIITIFPLIVWTLGGLEGPLFTFFCTAGILLFATAIDNNKNQISKFPAQKSIL